MNRSKLLFVSWATCFHLMLLVEPTMDAADGAEDMPPADRPTASQMLARPQPLVIAHRGASAEAPENTLPAFRLALEQRADLIELDYYHSADGVPVVFHDKTLDRTTDAKARWGAEQKTGSRNLAELVTLDAGKWFDPRFAGTRIPTLAQALDVIQDGSMTLIEHKAGDAATLVALLREKQLVDRVIVQSFDWYFLADCHELEPRLVLGALGSKELTSELVAAVERTGAQVVGWNHKDLTAQDLATLHGKGVKVWLYTVNSTDDAGRWLDLGIDGLISDVPGQMRQFRDARESNTGQ